MNDKYLKVKRFSDLLVLIKLMNGREEEGLRLYGLVLCTTVDTKHDNGWSRVSVICSALSGKGLLIFRF